MKDFVCCQIPEAWCPQEVQTQNSCSKENPQPWIQWGRKEMQVQSWTLDSHLVDACVSAGVLLWDHSDWTHQQDPGSDSLGLWPGTLQWLHWWDPDPESLAKRKYSGHVTLSLPVYSGGVCLSCQSQGDALRHWVDCLKNKGQRMERWHVLTNELPQTISHD